MKGERMIYAKAMTDAMVEWGWPWVRRQISRGERLGVERMCLNRFERAKASASAARRAAVSTGLPWFAIAFVAAAIITWRNTTPALYRRALFRAAGKLGVGWRHLEE